MITLRTSGDINWPNVLAVAYEQARLTIAPELLAVVSAGRERFDRLIADGVPCYGVTTGLGALVNLDLDRAAREDLPRNILRARAAAFGPALPAPVARATLMLRLVNFLSGRDGVSAELCQYIVDRLNDGFTPWIPRHGHGMAADAVANTHCFQTLIGEGYVIGEDDGKQCAADALGVLGVAPYAPGEKEGLALLNGMAGGPAYAIHGSLAVDSTIAFATLVATASMEAMAAPKDSMDAALIALSQPAGTVTVLEEMIHYARGSEIVASRLQAPISFRVIPQVHGALTDALGMLQARIDDTFSSFSDNPVMVETEEGGGRFLSHGGFHDQHLVNQVEHVAIALTHVGALSERRLHRLLDPQQTGLNSQLAPRPGLDAGLVVAHKATIALMARARVLAQPVSLLTAETSGGQEDYMSMLFPALDRLLELCVLVESVLCYELLAALVAIDMRGMRSGTVIESLRERVRRELPRLEKDRPPGPDVEQLLSLLDAGEFDDFFPPHDG